MHTIKQTFRTFINVHFEGHKGTNTFSIFTKNERTKAAGGVATAETQERDKVAQNVDGKNAERHLDRQFVCCSMCLSDRYTHTHTHTQNI